MSILPLLLGVAVALAPLDLPSAWQQLSYRGIPPNRITFEDGALTIHVDRSAGPLVWPMAEPARLQRVEVRGRVSGELKVGPDRQGLRGGDDFALRVGLVEAGPRRPTFVERRFAPAWVRHLFSLAPPEQGVGRIRFFNLGLTSSQIGWSRVHPRSALLHETVVAAPDAAGDFTIAVEPSQTPILALWLSADGDDTASTFAVGIDSIELR